MQCCRPECILVQVVSRSVRSNQGISWPGLSAPIGVKTQIVRKRKMRRRQLAAEAKKAKPPSNSPPHQPHQLLFQVGRHLVSYQRGASGLPSCARFNPHTHFKQMLLMVLFVQSEMIHWFGSHYILQTWPWCPLFVNCLVSQLKKHPHLSAILLE